MVTVGPPQLISECLLFYVLLLTSILRLLGLAKTWYPTLQTQPELQRTSKDISRAKWRTSCKQNQDLKCQQIAVWTCHGRKQLATCLTTTVLNWTTAMCNLLCWGNVGNKDIRPLRQSLFLSKSGEIYTRNQNKTELYEFYPKIHCRNNASMNSFYTSDHGNNIFQREHVN